MKLRAVKIKTWLCWTLLLAIVLLCWAPIQRMLAVAALQNTLERAWDSSFNNGERPDLLPEWLETKVRSSLTERFSEPSAVTSSTPTYAYNRDVLFRERFRILFRGPIHTIEVWYPQAFRGDLGASLQAFPSLRRFKVYENDLLPTEDQWNTLCQRLRHLENLQQIELGGAQLTDAAISQLAHHPNLQTVAITYGALTPASAATFASLPRLTSLRLKDQGRNGLSPEDQQKIREALPKVQIEFK